MLPVGVPSLAVRSAALNEMDDEVAVLDVDGTIIETNLRWSLFAAANQGAAEATGVGVNYLDVCDRSAVAGVAQAAEVAAGLRQILGGLRRHLEVVYACPSPRDDRWFELRASPLRVGGWAGAIVVHHDVTIRHQLWDEVRGADVGVHGVRPALLPGAAESTSAAERHVAERRRILRAGTLELCRTTKRAWLAGRDLRLPDMEFDLLVFLMLHEGEVFSPADLLREVWHSSAAWQSPATVTEHIHRLRRHVEAAPARPLLIRTVRGRGYCFVADAK